MEKLKIAVAVGTRPEIIRLSAIIKALNDSEIFDLTFIHTGQNYDYELNEIFFRDLTIPSPDYFLDAVGSSSGETAGNIIAKLSALFKRKSDFDAFLVLGDTDSALGAIAAKKAKIPVFHMEAGNRSFDNRVPEELNRKIVDSLADINMPYSDISRERLISEGFPANRIVTTGSPMREVLDGISDQVKSSEVLKRLDIESQGYIVVSLHRAENVSNKNELKEVVGMLTEVLRYFELPIIVSLHPRTKKEIEKHHPEFLSKSGIIFSKPFGFVDYVALQKNAYVTLSDSGTISEESDILGFPAVNIRKSHERHEAMEKGVVIMSGLNSENVIRSIIFEKSIVNRPSSQVKDYNVSKVSTVVMKVLLSYYSYE